MRKLLVILLAVSAAPTWSEVVFVGIGDSGELSFTDAALDGFEPTRVDVPLITEADAEATRRRVADMEAIAQAMAEDRKTRELARLPARPPAPAYDPVIVYEEAYRYPWYLPSQPLPPGKPPSVAPPPEPPPRKPFEPAFRPYTPVNGSTR